MRFRILRRKPQKKNTKIRWFVSKTNWQLIKSLPLLPLIHTPSKAGISWLPWNILTVNSKARKIRKLPPHLLLWLLYSFTLKKKRKSEYCYSVLIVAIYTLPKKKRFRHSRKRKANTLSKMSVS